MREIDKTLPKDQRILLAAEEVFSRAGDFRRDHCAC